MVLSEHFRCAPDIIDFSNKQFYDDRLVPLRLPKESERLSPSLLDVKVNGTKVGKINEGEADKIVELIQEHMKLPGSDIRPRSIGVISLIGDEQSRLIRGRLLDAVGPEKMSRHNVLIGDPPTFQGAERDIVFLSMVCSRGSVPTQSQLMHFQRANVAMSRARDRCVLVRSIDLTDISSLDDMKVPIIEHFLQGADSEDEDSMNENDSSKGNKMGNASWMLKQLLQDRGFTVSDMGVIWKNGICVENGNTRVALLVDGDEFSRQDWKASYGQQKAIERVGWKCFRVDALSLFVNLESSMKNIMNFLSDAKIQALPDVHLDAESQDAAVENIQPVEQMEEEDETMPIVLDDDEVVRDSDAHDVVTISSCDEEEADEKPAACPDRIESSFDFAEHEDVNAARFGQVVELDFLRQVSTKEEEEEEDGADSRENEAMLDLSGDVDNATGMVDLTNDRADGPTQMYVKEEQSIPEEVPPPVASVARLPTSKNSYDGLSNFSSSDDSSVYSKGSSKRSKKYKYRKLDKYARDGRWYPNKKDGEDVDVLYDTDSDLPKIEVVDVDEEYLPKVEAVDVDEEEIEK